MCTKTLHVIKVIFIIVKSYNKNKNNKINRKDKNARQANSIKNRKHKE